MRWSPVKLGEKRPPFPCLSTTQLILKRSCSFLYKKYVRKKKQKTFRRSRSDIQRHVCIVHGAVVFKMLLRCWETKFCKFGVFLLFPSLVPPLSSLPCRQRLDGQGGADWGSYSKSPPALVLESLIFCCRFLLLPPFPTNPTSLTLCLSISPTFSLLKKWRKKSLWKRRGSV